jgi:hypothetical protein
MKRRTIAAFCLSLCLGVTAVAAGGDDACLPKGGMMVDGKCVLSIETRVSVDYPLELAQNEVVASTIDPFIETSKDEFLLSVSQFSPAPGPYEMDMTYEETQYSDTITSLVFITYAFTGGAHGNTTYQTFTFDLANGTVITLDDLFTDTEAALAVIEPIVVADLTASLGDMYNADMLAPGTAPTPENYQYFALDGDNLIFYFPPYQVAPYAAGTQTVSIPLS